MKKIPRATVMIAAAAAVGATSLAAQQGSAVSLKVTGGAHAGSYSISEQAPCDFQDGKKGNDPAPAQFLGSFAPEYPPGSNSQLRIRPNDIGRVALTVPNVRSPKPGVFHLAVVFGDVSDRRNPGTLYEVYTVPVAMRDEFTLAVDGPKPVSGKGEVKIDRKGKQARLTFWGETAKGVRMEGVITCDRISAR